MPDASGICPECGAVWYQDDTCQDRFYQMLYWENENPGDGAEVHHLMVLCYHLQHPGLYSPEGLREACRLLVTFSKHNAAPSEVRRRNRIRVASGNRTWRITATPFSHGSYDSPVKWTMTAADVIARGPERYGESVRAWAQSIYTVLEASGVFSSD